MWSGLGRRGRHKAGGAGVECVRAPTGPCWQGGRRQHGLARARLHFESGLGPLHPSAPIYAAEGTEGEGEGQASWGRLEAGRGAVSHVEGQLAGPRVHS